MAVLKDSLMSAATRLVSLAALSALAACATTGDNVRASTRGEGDDGAQRSERQANAQVDRDARRRIAREDTLTQMTFWAREYQAFPDDLEAAQKLTEALRAGGRHERAAEVANEAIGRHPDDVTLQRTLGFALLSAGRPNPALRPLAIAAAADPQDWASRSALGVALDQLGRMPEAQRAYREALAIRADEPGVLTNMGVSHLLAGSPADAEAVLRQAAALPNAPPAARQNLALAIGLQGRFDEAEQLERIDLPPAMVAENMAYIRGLLSTGRRWSDVGGSATTR